MHESFRNTELPEEKNTSLQTEVTGAETTVSCKNLLKTLPW